MGGPLPAAAEPGTAYRRIHPSLMTLIVRLLFILALLAGLPAPGTAQTSLIPGQAPAATAPAAPSKDAAAPAPDAALKALVEVLKDEQSRSKLLQELERLSAKDATTAAPASEPASAAAPKTQAQPQQDTSLARELSEYTQQVGRDAVAVVLKVWYGLANLTRLVDGSTTIDWEHLWNQSVSLVQLALVAIAVWYVLRWLSVWPIGLIARVAVGAPTWKRGVLVLSATLLDILALSIALFAALTFEILASPSNRIEVIESLFLNAFVLIEALKVGLRAFLQPNRPSLRLVPLTDATARFWHFWLARLAGFLGYGVMLVYPIVNSTVGFAVGIGVRLAIVIVATVGVIGLVNLRCEPLRSELLEAAGRIRGGASRLAVTTAAHIWHLLVTAYVLGAFLVWVTRPFDAVSYMAAGTLETIAVLVVGGLALSGLTRLIEGGIRLPAEARRSLPLLEKRLELLVPTFLRVVRLLVFLVVAAAILQAWDLVDLRSFIESDRGSELVGRIISALVIVGVAMAIWIACTSWIEYRMSPASGRVSTARARTLLSLFRNAFSIVVVLITTMLALSELGVDIAPLVAGAGVVGLAVGFGSQKLVQDIITGAFIQFENAMNEGDVVTVAGISGVVDRLTIRSVAIRDVNGVYHVIPFSSVDSVSNAMRGFAFHVADVTVSYRENVETVKRLMGVAFERLMATEHGASILEPLEMNGVTQFLENAVVIRGRIKTLPGQQWAVGRAYNEFIKSVLDENGIELPFARTAVLVDGHAQTAPAAPAKEAPSAAPAATGHRRRRPAETLDVPDSPRRREERDGDPDDAADGDGADEYR